MLVTITLIRSAAPLCNQGFKRKTEYARAIREDPLCVNINVGLAEWKIYATYVPVAIILTRSTARAVWDGRLCVHIKVGVRFKGRFMSFFYSIYNGLIKRIAVIYFNVTIMIPCHYHCILSLSIMLYK